MKDKEIQTQQDVDDLNKKIDGCKTNQQIVDTLKTVKLDKIPIMPVSAKDQYTEQKLRYIPYYEQDATGGLEFEFFTSHMNAVKSPLLLTGPTGTAKTLAVAWFAQENDAVCLQVDCSEGTKRADLLGRFIKLDGSSK